MNDEANLSPVRRRRHSAQFKSEVIAACRQPGVSIAATALRYGLNANMVRIWIRDFEKAHCEPAPAMPVAEFVQLEMPQSAKPASSPDIVIEIKRGASVVNIHWPSASAGECSQWLQNWLR